MTLTAQTLYEIAESARLPLSNWQQRSRLREGRAEEAANAPLSLLMSRQSAHWESVAEVAQLSGLGWQFT